MTSLGYQLYVLHDDSVESTTSWNPENASTKDLKAYWSLILREKYQTVQTRSVLPRRKVPNFDAGWHIDKLPQHIPKPVIVELKSIMGLKTQQEIDEWHEFCSVQDDPAIKHMWLATRKPALTCHFLPQFSRQWSQERDNIKAQELTLLECDGMIQKRWNGNAEHKKLAAQRKIWVAPTPEANLSEFHCASGGTHFIDGRVNDEAIVFRVSRRLHHQKRENVLFPRRTITQHLHNGYHASQQSYRRQHLHKSGRFGPSDFSAATLQPRGSIIKYRFVGLPKQKK
ncbi:hypothetical protein DFH09DRAFT_1082140 [Mycena vulgaris]|nr:hypothetical protein DFH09DRAFT_1082140 [Mycena vulgaris]